MAEFFGTLLGRSGKQGDQSLLGVKPVLGFVKHGALGSVSDIVGDLFSIVRR